MGRHSVNTGIRRLAEASSSDTILGIELRADNPATAFPAAWRGTNGLGEAPQQVRAWLAADHDPTVDFPVEPARLPHLPLSTSSKLCNTRNIIYEVHPFTRQHLFNFDG